MKPEKYVEFLNLIAQLKKNTRHSWTDENRKESVAEHSWRLAVMALLCSDEYPHLDMNKVIKMCLIHDFGEAITGDVPSFYKTDDHERREEEAINTILQKLPDEYKSEFSLLYREMSEMKTEEAKLFKALDNMEAVVSHNEAPISTWIPLEYTENLVYGEENCRFSPWTVELREFLKQESIEKIAREGKKTDS